LMMMLKTWERTRVIRRCSVLACVLVCSV
jgi:hypothetical protein